MGRFLPAGMLVALVAMTGLCLANAGLPETTVAIIVAAEQNRTLKLSDLALIYRRKKLFWNGGTLVNPVNLQASHPLRRLFSDLVLDASPEDLERYWNDLYFHGISPPFVLASEEAVIRFVARTPGAVGYVSYCNVDSRVRVALIISASGPVSESRAKSTCSR